VRVALAQLDSTLGDVDGNLKLIHDLTRQANAGAADLTVFPELATHGYALGDIARDCSLAAEDPRMSRLSGEHSDVLVGFHEDGGVRTYDSAAYFSRGALVRLHRKLYLPNYLAWEERKYSSPGESLRAFDTRHGRVATLICYDAWQPVLPWLAAQDGAEILLIPTNSAASPGPDSLDPMNYWNQLLPVIARMQQCWVVFVNRVGTESGARFWGASRVLDPTGEVVAEAPLWEDALVTVDIDVSSARRQRHEVPLLADARLRFVDAAVHRLVDEDPEP
jgi:predicted amidohydrolase